MRLIGVTFFQGKCKAAVLSLHRKGFTIEELIDSAPEKTLSEGRVVCALPEKELLIKRCKVPNTHARTLRKMLPFQIDALFSIPKEGFIFHPFVMPHSRDVFLCAASQRTVDRVIQESNPHALSTDVQALLRFYTTYIPQAKALCMLHLSESGITAVSVDKGSFYKSTTFATEAECAENIRLLFPAKKQLPILLLGHKAMRSEVTRLMPDAQWQALPAADGCIEYAMEIGLALEGGYDDELSVNFRKSEREHPSHVAAFNKTLALCLASLGVLCCSLFGLFTLMQRHKEAALRAEYTEIVSRYPELFEGADRSMPPREAIAWMQDRLRSAKKNCAYTRDPLPFSHIVSAVTRTAAEHDIAIEKLDYTLTQYPLKKKPSEKFRARCTLRLVSTDALRVKTLCEALEAYAWLNQQKGVELQRDETGFFAYFTCVL